MPVRALRPRARLLPRNSTPRLCRWHFASNGNGIEVTPDGKTLGAVTRYVGSASFDFPATIAEVGGSLHAVNANFDQAPPPAPNPLAKFSVVRVSK